jgi:rhodanese-related sulfurtransferase
MREVNLPAFAAAHASGAVVIDVREPHEYIAGHVPGARLLPLARLDRARTVLPRSEPIYVICASGNRSKSAADLLTRAGYEAYSVAGGTSAWMHAGHPVAYGVA